ncbi:hypothetical protein AAG570_000222 [Ranatra chinensis]|uniref:Uncharacterized protein n=1 Tax=Ranatra chinensis TaxID=642074 RepID=A0ABD0YWQ7_9HEMI
MLSKIYLPGEGDEELELANTDYDLETSRLYHNMTSYMGVIKSTVPIPLEESGEGEELIIQFDAGEQLRCFEEAGIGLPKLEIFQINAAMLRLLRTEPISKIRFWGKIFGLKMDYYIVECELKDDEVRMRRAFLKQQLIQCKERCRASQVLQIMSKHLTWMPTFVEARNEEELKLAILLKRSKLKKYEVIPLPCIKPTREIPVPQERTGEGCNKKVYLVCNNPNGQWTMLPEVKPENIVAARKMKAFFSGDLSAPFVSWTGEGPETEMEYLRAQIARISAGTQISPLGFYSFSEGGEGEEEEAEEEGDEGANYRSYVMNSDFQPLPLRDLVEPTMSFWVHHTDHILKQGRVLWWNGKIPKDSGEGEGEEDKEGIEGGEGLEEVAAEAEIGPALLTPLSEDATLEGTPPWTARVSPKYLPQKFAILRSNLWPGAYAYASGRNFDNIYFGWGVKYQPYGFPMSCSPTVQKMYDIGPDVMEAVEPTLQMEEEWHYRNLKPEAPDDRLGGEGELKHGEGEIGEEEEEDD